MRSLTSPRVLRTCVAALVAGAIIIGSTAPAAAKPPPKPSPSPSIAIAIAPSGTLVPSGEYANVDVTVTRPIGRSWSYGRLYVLQGDRGGSGTFSVACTGTAQVGHAWVVNGNRFSLGDWSATA